MTDFLKARFCSIAGILVFASLLIWRETVLGWLRGDLLDLQNLYNAIFGWSSIQTGFLFSVYGYITSKQDGFVQAIKHTEGMQFFNSTLWKAITIGFLLTVTSMPFLAAPIEPQTFGFLYVAVAAWFGLFVWAFLLFFRAAYTFGVISTVPDNREMPAG